MVVEQDHVRLDLPAGLEAGLGVAGRGRLIARVLQGYREDLDEVRVVVDDEDARHRYDHSVPLYPSEVNTLPVPPHPPAGSRPEAVRRRVGEGRRGGGGRSKMMLVWPRMERSVHD
jgi:hypothetical protein